MTNFKMKKTSSILKSVNPRKENHGEDLVLATDLKLQVVMPGSILTEITDTKAAWDFFCWDKSSEEVRPNGVDHFALEARFDDHVLHIFVGDKTMTFEGVTLKKFKAKPIDGKRVEMTFQAQIYPVKDQIAMLANVLMEQIKIKIDEPRQQDLVKDSENKTEDEDA